MDPPPSFRPYSMGGMKSENVCVCVCVCVLDTDYLSSVECNSSSSSVIFLYSMREWKVKINPSEWGKSRRPLAVTIV